MDQKDTCTTVFTAALSTIAKTQKQSKCPSADGWLKNMWYTHTAEYYSDINKNGIRPICSNMDRPRDYCAKGSKSDREKQISDDIIYMQNLKKNTINKIIYKTETDL